MMKRIALFALLLSACGGTAAVTTTTTLPGTTTSTTAPTTTTTTPILTDNLVAQIDNGRYIGFITHLAESGLTGGPEVHYDLAVWFEGDAADAAALEDGEESPRPNDYYIRNVDPLELVVPISPNVAITSVWYHYDTYQDLESRPVTLEELAAAMTGEPVGSQEVMWSSPWWVTVVDGEVVAIDEQYVP